MKRFFMIQYRCRFEASADHVEFIQSMIREIVDQHVGVHYGVFRIGGGSEFVHLVQTESLVLLAALDRDAELQDEIESHFESAPVISELHEVSSVRFFDAEHHAALGN